MAGSGAKRYARAIFELAKDDGQVDDWSRRLAVVCDLLGQPDVRATLANPSIPVQRRQEVATALLEDRAGPEGVNLAKLLVSARRLDDCDAIRDEYQRLADEEAGRVRAVATTAVKLSAVDADKLEVDLTRKLGREVRLDVTVDRRIIGGLVLQIGDRVIDASVAARLQQLRRRLAGV